jgi:death on curing protein
MIGDVEVEDLLLVLGECTPAHTRVRDVSILYSAAARPESVVLDRETFETVPERAAALLHAVVRWEPLDMWNASLGWRAARLMAERNGGRLKMSPLDQMELINAITGRQVDDVPEIAKLLAPFFVRTE